MARLEQSRADTTVQRAIEARYLPAARAEREDAQAASREAKKPARSRVGWSSRPTNADRRRDEQRAAEKADLARQRDRRRAAEQAPRALASTAEEIALRAAIAARDQVYRFKRHSTPATMEAAAENVDCIEARTRRAGALARLYATRSIDADQLASAVAIAAISERLARDVTTKAAAYEMRIDGGHRGGEADERLGQVQREVAYTRWRGAVRGPLDAVLDMIVGDTVGYTVVARRYGMSEPRTKRLLIDALDLWPRIYGQARRDIDQRDVDRIHARLG